MNRHPELLNGWSFSERGSVWVEVAGCCLETQYQPFPLKMVSLQLT